MSTLRSGLYSSALVLVATIGTSSVARAQEPASGLLTSKPATEGSTNVTTEGFDKIDVKKEAAAKDATELQLSAGVLGSSGNARLVSLTGSGRFRARRADNQFSLALAGNRSSSSTKEGQPMQTTLANVQGKIRYDRFLGEGFAAFLSLSGRNDRFQGLLLRTNLDPGIAYYFVDTSVHQLWTELGYDWQHDLRRESSITAAEAQGIFLDKTDTRHSGRLFLGYNGSVNKAVSFTTGAEYLQGLQDTKFWRFNWDAGLNSALSNSFSFSTTFSLRYDHAPLPGVRNTDTITAVNLVYSLL
jgi:putative salt-induced outer membrane protein YdiY